MEKERSNFAQLWLSGEVRSVLQRQVREQRGIKNVSGLQKSPASTSCAGALVSDRGSQVVSDETNMHFESYDDFRSSHLLHHYFGEEESVLNGGSETMDLFGNIRSSSLLQTIMNRHSGHDVLKYQNTLEDNINSEIYWTSNVSKTKSNIPDENSARTPMLVRDKGVNRGEVADSPAASENEQLRAIWKGYIVRFRFRKPYVQSLIVQVREARRLLLEKYEDPENVVHTSENFDEPKSSQSSMLKLLRSSLRSAISELCTILTRSKSVPLSMSMTSGKRREHPFLKKGQGRVAVPIMPAKNAKQAMKTEVNSPMNDISSKDHQQPLAYLRQQDSRDDIDIEPFDAVGFSQAGASISQNNVRNVVVDSAEFAVVRKPFLRRKTRSVRLVKCSARPNGINNAPKDFVKDVRLTDSVDVDNTTQGIAEGTSPFAQNFDCVSQKPQFNQMSQRFKNVKGDAAVRRGVEVCRRLPLKWTVTASSGNESNDQYSVEAVGAPKAHELAAVVHSLRLCGIGLRSCPSADNQKFGTLGRLIADQSLFDAYENPTNSAMRIPRLTLESDFFLKLSDREREDEVLSSEVID